MSELSTQGITEEQAAVAWLYAHQKNQQLLAELLTTFPTEQAEALIRLIGAQKNAALYEQQKPNN